MTDPKQKFAVFDIDGTVYRFSLLIELVKVLVREGIFPPETEKRYRVQYENWQNRVGSYDDYINLVIQAFLENIRGASLEKVMSAAQAVVSEQGQRTYAYTKGLVERLKRKRYFLVYVSHSPHAVVGEFSRHFGFNAHQGTLYEIDEQGCFTGRLQKNNSFHKSEVLQEIVERHDLDLNDSYGIGDTEADIEMLRLVRRPICFNPNRRLFESAQQENWPVIVERKDLILSIRGDSVSLDNVNCR